MSDTATSEPAFCHQMTVPETVVTTTYNAVCPVHGVVAVGLSLQEATDYRCAMPHKNGSEAEEYEPLPEPRLAPFDGDVEAWPPNDHGSQDPDG